ncbi:hypothetical protein INR49_028652 [Caranx melampygus]|nr:hypothetical protein INR49_028652 [Caranx melampygus]
MFSSVVVPQQQPRRQQGSSSSSSSSEGTGSLYSWSSGVTCLLHSSIKKQSQEAFQTRLREERRWGELAACPSRWTHGRGRPQAEQGGGNNHNKRQAWPERDGLGKGRGSAQIHTSARSVKLQLLLEEKIETKLKFSQFLDEVTSNVIDPNSLQAFGRPVSPSSSSTTNPDLTQEQIQVVSQRSPRLPCSMAQQQGSLLKPKKPQEEQNPHDLTQKTYLETDIDAVRAHNEQQHQEIKADATPQLDLDGKNVIPPPPQFCQGFEMKSPCPEFYHDFPRYPYRSASLPRGINMVWKFAFRFTGWVNTGRTLSNSAGQT